MLLSTAVRPGQSAAFMLNAQSPHCAADRWDARHHRVAPQPDTGLMLSLSTANQRVETVARIRSWRSSAR
jgi:hypothetical protein